MIKNKKIKKLLNNPTLYFIDYLKKRPVFQSKVENYSNIVPLSKYHYHLYLKYKSLNYNLKAENSLLNAIRLNPKPDYYYDLGIRLKQKKQWWQAVNAFSKAIELSATPPKIWYKEYALVLTQMNRTEDAASAWHEALNNSKNANDWFLYGYTLELSKRENLSKEAYVKAIAYDKDKNAKEFGIGIFHEKRGYWIPASQAYGQSTKEKPLDAKLRYRYALALDRCYKWEEAEEEYLKAISLQPESIDWYYRLGFVRERQGKYELAAKSYSYAVENRKVHTPYWYYRLAYVLDKVGCYKESSDAFLMMKKIKAPKIEEKIELFIYQNYEDTLGENYFKFVSYLLDEKTTKKDILEKVYMDQENIDEDEKKKFILFLLDEKTTKKDIWNKLMQKGRN